MKQYAPTKEYFKDSLTNVYNRYFLDEFMRLELKRKMRYGGYFSVLLCDLDNFKNVNDTYGHLAGDTLLVKFSALVKRILRASDILVRFGGDEFIIILPDTSPVVAINVGKRIVKSVYNDVELKKFGVGVSIGVAGYPEDGSDYKTIMEAADQSLYSAKKAGKNRTAYLQSKTPQRPVLPSKKFVGRGKYIERMQDILKKESSNVIIVEGEVGSGKTRLIEELFHQSQDVFYAASTTFGMQIPYFTLRETLKKLYREDPYKFKDSLKNLKEFARDVIEFLMPALSRHSIEQLESEYTVYEAFKSFVTEYNKNNAVILIMDDFQWIDRESLNAILYLTVNIHNIKLILVKRKEEESQYMDEFLKSISGVVEVSKMELTSFTYDETGELINNILGKGYSTALLKYIYSLSAGNPFFIEETIKELFQNGNLQFEKGIWKFEKPKHSVVSTSVDATLSRKFKQLSKDEMEYLTIMSLWGDWMSETVLSGLTGTNEGHLLSFFDKMTGLKLVRHDPNMGYKPSCGIVIQAALRDLTETKKKFLHRKIAGFIESNIADKNGFAEQLALHYYYGGEKDKALQYLKKALSVSETLRTVKKSLDFLNKILEIEKEAVYFEKRGDCNLDAGNIEEARADYEEAIKLGANRDKLMRKISEVYAREGESEKAYNILVNLKPEDKDLANLIKGDIAWYLMENGNYTESEKAMKEVINYWKEHDIDRYHFYLHYLAVLYNSMGRFNDAVAISRKAVDYFKQQKKVNLGPINTYGLALKNLLRTSEAINVFSSGAKLAEEKGLPYHRSIMEGNLGLVYWDSYQYEKAVLAMEKSFNTLLSIGVFETAAFTISNLVQLIFDSSMLELGEISKEKIRHFLDLIKGLVKENSSMETKIMQGVVEALYWSYFKDKDMAKTWADRLMTLSKEMAAGNMKIFALSAAADALRDVCELKDSLNIYRKVYRMSGLIDNKEWLIFAKAGIYDIFYKANKKDKARKYEEGLKRLENELDETLKVVLHETLCNMYIGQGEKDKAIGSYKLLESLYDKFDDEKKAGALKKLRAINKEMTEKFGSIE